MAESSRLLVSVPPDVYRALRRISELSGRSMASFLRDVAVAAAPSFERIADAMQAARDLGSAHQDAARGVLELAEAALSDRTALGASEVDRALEPPPKRRRGGSGTPCASMPRSAKGGPKSPRPSPSSEGPLTPGSNTGVTFRKVRLKPQSALPSSSPRKRGS